MIVKNEEHYLKRCLSSAKELVDEIIIVDTGSTDGTLEIANNFGHKVAKVPWANDFSLARNHSLDLATCEWIIYLDADEELVIDDKDKFKELLRRKDVEGYFFNIINFTSDTPGGQRIKHTNLRLFKNRPQYRFKGALHEQIIPSILEFNPNAKLLGTDITIIHHGYKNKDIELKDKNTRNLNILKNQLNKDAENVFLRYNFAVSLLRNKQLEEAINEFEKIYKKLDLKAGYTPTVFRNYAVCLLERNLPQRALEVLDDGIRLFPDYTDLHYLKGQCLEKLNRITMAQKCYLRCLEIGEANSKYVSTEGIGGFCPLRNLGNMMKKSGHHQLALMYYQRAYQSNPEHRQTLFDLGQALKKVLKEPLKIRAYIKDKIKVTNIEQLINLAELLYSVDDYDGCITYLNEAIIKGGIKSPRLTMLKGRCLSQLGRWDDARLQYLEIDLENPLIKDAVIESCLCCWLAEPIKNAAQIIDKLKIKDNLTYSFLNAINNNLIHQEKEKIQVMNPEITEKIIAKLIEYRQGEMAKKIILLLDDYSEGEVLYHIGKALFNQKIYLEASNYLLDALSADINHHDLYFMLGSICLNRRALWEAEQLIQQAIQIKAESRYYEKLVEILLAQAYETALEAVAEFPENNTFKKILNEIKNCQLEYEVVRGSC
ncbi:TPR domain-containing glycosyltransferase [Desulfofalx alkaliphila]|uniref:TPR domain-containing glycosyltransferase n=1 Tax=Desulfofalx alkaliphila TaxID=105483 RepID=UPI00146F9CD7|nr:TPR domain-containing glycosyltransferase [Desulfofalx alkaliphila]